MRIKLKMLKTGMAKPYKDETQIKGFIVTSNINLSLKDIH